MGSVRLGAPDDALALRDAYGVNVFIETGTYKGGTARWAAEHFKTVITIEAYRPRYDSFAAGGPPPNVTALFGDSRTLLAQVLTSENARVMLWLDAHWCGEGAHDANGDECPLREELQAVLEHEAESGVKHVILIDDARLFTSPPPYPHDPAQWPTYDEIVALLPGRNISIKDDVIYVLPR